MANIAPTFDQLASGSGSTPKEFWVDLGLIPNSRQIWFGFGTLIAEDKNLVFELRTNNQGASTGDTTNTTLNDWSSAPSGTSIDRDFFHSGTTIIMSAQSTGVEHWWLRLRSGSSTLGNFDYIIYYALY